MAVLNQIMRSQEMRRPQLVLAREGTHSGGLGMQRLGFDVFGDAPWIQAAYTDGERFSREYHRRDQLHAARSARARRQERGSAG